MSPVGILPDVYTSCASEGAAIHLYRTRQRAGAAMNQTKQAPILEIPLENRKVWTGTEAQLRREHPDWLDLVDLDALRAQAIRRTEETRGVASDVINLATTRSRQPVQADVELEEDDRYYTTKPHTSAVRYDQPNRPRVQARPGQFVNVPQRRSRQEAPATEQIVQPKRHIHWLAIAGIGAIVVLLLLLGAWAAHNKWLSSMDDWTYTSTFRTFSTDAVVGHNNDSPAHPSHFI